MKRLRRAYNGPAHALFLLAPALVLTILALWVADEFYALMLFVYGCIFAYSQGFSRGLDVGFNRNQEMWMAGHVELLEAMAPDVRKFAPDHPSRTAFEEAMRVAREELERVRS